MNSIIRVKALGTSPYLVSCQKTGFLGAGSFAEVYKAYHSDRPNQLLVAKIISLTNFESLNSIKIETEVLKNLPYHPNLVNYKKIKLTSSKNCYFIMQFCNNGNLEQKLNKLNWQVAEEWIWEFLGQIVNGYKHLIQHNILHRDLKPENILINDDIYKIADFGLSKILSDGCHLEVSCKGSPAYMAPQLFMQGPVCSKIDLYSLGVILYRMMHRGNFPYISSERKYSSLNSFIKDVQSNELIINCSSFSEQLVLIVRKCLEKQVGKRMSWDSLMEKRRQRFINVPTSQKMLFKVVRQSNTNNILYQSSCIKVKHITQYLLQKRQVILFVDRVALKSQYLLNQLLANRRAQNSELCDLCCEFNLMYNEELYSLLFNKNCYFRKKDYEVFESTEDFRMLDELLRQDRNYLQEFYSKPVGAKVRTRFYQVLKKNIQVLGQVIGSESDESKGVRLMQFKIYLLQIVLFLQSGKGSILKQSKNWQLIEQLYSEMSRATKSSLLVLLFKYQ